MTQLVSLWYFLTYSVLFDIPKHILSPYPGLLPVPSCPSEIFSLIWHIFYWLLQSSNLKPPLLTHGPIPDFMASRDTHTTMNAHFTSYVSHFHSFSHNYHNFIFPYGREKNHSLYTEHILLFISWGTHNVIQLYCFCE